MNQSLPCISSKRAKARGTQLDEETFQQLRLAGTKTVIIQCIACFFYLMSTVGLKEWN